MSFTGAMRRARGGWPHGLVVWFLVAVAVAPVLGREDAGEVKPGDEVLGIWHTTDDKSRVEISKKDGKYVGTIVALKDPYWPENDEQGMGGKPKNDRRNPDRNLRSRTIVGMQFMTDFTYSGKHHWTGGRIYDPESGKTYHSKMTLLSDGRLELRGYVGVSLLGRTVVWSRKAPPAEERAPPQ